MEKRQTKKEILPDKSRRVGDLLFPDKPLWSMANMDIGPTLDPPLSQPTEYLEAQRENEVQILYFSDALIVRSNL